MNNESPKRFAALIQCFSRVEAYIVSTQGVIFGAQLVQVEWEELHEWKAIFRLRVSWTPRKKICNLIQLPIRRARKVLFAWIKHASRAELGLERSLVQKLNAVLTPIWKNVNAARNEKRNGWTKHQQIIFHRFDCYRKISICWTAFLCLPTPRYSIDGSRCWLINRSALNTHDVTAREAQWAIAPKPRH